MNTMDDLRNALITMRDRMTEVKQARDSTASPQWRARFDTLLQKGQWVMSMVEKLGNAIDGFTDWVRGVVGNRQQLSGIPLIIGAVAISAMLAYIVPYTAELANAMDEYRATGNFDAPTNPGQSLLQDVRGASESVKSLWKFGKIALPLLGGIWLINQIWPSR